MANSLRLRITQYFCAIAFEGKSASDILHRARHESTEDIGYIQECVFGTARHFFSLEAVLNSLLEKKLANKHSDIKSLLLTGIYQLEYLKTPDHAVISESVETARELGKEWACRLVNAVLRNYQRDRVKLQLLLQQNSQAQAELPDWLIKRINNAWKSRSKTVFEELKQKPPLVLRLNQSHPDHTEALKLLKEAAIEYELHPVVDSAIVLTKPVPVEEVPKFHEGLFSVQDTAAQLAAWLLPIESGNRVLDACAAPGGKTAHLLERHAVQVVALDNQASRAEKIDENLKRLHLQANVLVADATSWQSDEPFDAILLDAPCSATGVIRRQPDIKLHRRDDDIYPLVKLQRALLENCWQQLKPGGHLLYATCSLLPDENSKQIKRFCRDHADVTVIKIDSPFSHIGECSEFGLQLFPNHLNDGFFYSLLQKQAS